MTPYAKSLALSGFSQWYLRAGIFKDKDGKLVRGQMKNAPIERPVVDEEQHQIELAKQRERNRRLHDKRKALGLTNRGTPPVRRPATVWDKIRACALKKKTFTPLDLISKGMKRDVALSAFGHLSRKGELEIVIPTKLGPYGHLATYKRTQYLQQPAKKK
jgi:hypothetical protein